MSLTVTLKAFALSGFSFAGGTATVPPNAITHVGVRLSDNAVVMTDGGVNVDRSVIWLATVTANVNTVTLVVEHDPLIQIELAEISVDSATGLRDDLASTAAGKGAELVGFKQAVAGAVARTVQDKARESVSLFDFVPPAEHASIIAGTSSYDCYSALVTALASGASLVTYSGGVRVSAGITIPAGVTLHGMSFVPGREDAKDYLIFDTSVSTCISVAPPVLKSAALKNVCVFRAPGAVPAGSTAVYVDRGYNTQMENVFVFGHAKGYKFRAIEAAGISAVMRNCYGGGITEDYFDIDSWPELRVIGGRMGTNGVGDTSGNSFIRITGTSPQSFGIGPNGIIFENVQFNQGALGPNYWVDFEDIGVALGNQVFFCFSHCHVENNAVAYFRASGAGTAPSRVSLNTVQLNTPVPFFEWAETAVINEWRIENSFIAATTFAPTANVINGLSLVANDFVNCDITYNAPAGQSWNLASAANKLVAGSTMTISGSGWTCGFFADVLNSGTSLSNTASPRKNITVITPGASLTGWTPILSFGGDSTGITYSVQSAACHVVGSCVTYQFRTTLTNKGTATGAARITGFPVSQNSAPYQAGGGGQAFGVSGMSGLTSPILLNGPLGAPAYIQMATQGATSLATVTDANFTNSSNIAGTVTFFL